MSRAVPILALSIFIVLPNLQESSQHAFRIYEENGVMIAETTGGPKYDGELFSYEPILTLKPDPEREDSYLNSPGFFTQDDKSNYYVVDGGDLAVKVFDSSGSYVLKFGQNGAGPGDFWAISLVHIDGDVITLFDVLLERFTRFRTDGSLIDVVRTPHVRDSIPTALYPLPENRQLLIARLNKERSNRRWYAMRAAFLSAEFDTLQEITTDSQKSVIIITYGTRRATEGIPFSPRPSIAYLKGEAVFSTSGVNPVVEKYDLEGNLKERFEIRQEPVPVTIEEQSELKRRLRRLFENATSPRLRAHYKAIIDDYEIPDFKAYSRGMILDGSGFIWLEVPEQDSDSFRYHGPLYRILSPEGEYLGLSRWPGIQGTLKNGRLLAYTRNEETDEMTATVYRIHPAINGLRYPN